MGVYEITVFSIVIIAVAFHYGKGNDKYKFIFTSMFLLFLISALRNGYYTGDTFRYQIRYDTYRGYSLRQMLDLYRNEKLKDPTYYLTGWFFSRLFKNSQWWLAFLSAFFCFASGRLIYKKSLAPLVSIIMLAILTYFKFSMTGLRQSVAIALVLLSYPFLEKKKLVPFVITVILASLYHQTALIFLIAYPLSRVKIGKYHVVFAIAMLGILYLYQDWLLGVLNNALGEEERYGGVLGGNAATLTISGFIIQGFIFAFSMFYYRRMLQRDKDSIVLYNLSFLGIVFQLYSTFIATIFRISLYFSIFNIILAANVTECEDNEKDRQFVRGLIIAVLLIYMLQGGKYNYRFYWQ